MIGACLGAEDLWVNLQSKPTTFEFEEPVDSGFDPGLDCTEYHSSIENPSAKALRHCCERIGTSRGCQLYCACH